MNWDLAMNDPRYLESLDEKLLRDINMYMGIYIPT